MAASTAPIRFNEAVDQAVADERAPLIHDIENAGRRMSRRVSDLIELALSRLGGGMPINRLPFDLGHGRAIPEGSAATRHIDYLSCTAGERLRSAPSGLRIA